MSKLEAILDTKRETTVEELAEKHWATGIDHYDAGRLTDALSAWQEGLRADPDDAVLHYNIGVVLSEMGRQEEALAHLREAVRQQSDLYEARYHLVCNLQKRMEQARKDQMLSREVRQHCRAALALPSEDDEQKAYLLHVLGGAEWNLGKQHQAIEAVHESISLKPKQGACERLARMQARTGQWRASWQTFQTMMEQPDFDLTSYDVCFDRLRAISVLAGLVGGVLLFRMLKRR